MYEVKIIINGQSLTFKAVKDFEIIFNGKKRYEPIRQEQGAFTFVRKDKKLLDIKNNKIHICN